MRVLPKLLATVLLSGGVTSAQVAPYVGGGIGVNGLSFQLPYYNVDAGVDWGSPRSTLFEAEAGAEDEQEAPLQAEAPRPESSADVAAPPPEAGKKDFSPLRY